MATEATPPRFFIVLRTDLSYDYYCKKSIIHEFIPPTNNAIIHFIFSKHSMHLPKTHKYVYHENISLPFHW